MGNTFDPFQGQGKGLALFSKWLGWSYKAGRGIKARNARKQVEELYGPEVADAVEAAVRSVRDPYRIIERARRDVADREEHERQLADPPPLYGSARWPTAAELQVYLRDKDAFDDTRSILLGSYIHEDLSRPASYVHWDGDGHLLTIAPTRSGKALTTIIPNLLRYQGSCVVLDPKGELYEATSRWRGSLGPVYRIAPFSTDDTKSSQRFDPVSQIGSEADTLQRFGRWLLTWMSELYILRLSRKREYWADAFGAALTSRDDMIRALEKLHAGPELSGFEKRYSRLMVRGFAGGSLLSIYPTLDERQAALQGERYLRKVTRPVEATGELAVPVGLPTTEEIAYARSRRSWIFQTKLFKGVMK